ncbi:MAG: ChbG/HpnK family deacetylase [Planctomycetota bacterium]|jgi:predicted glycoside hydrolase/deacetylase ChbG (UPF0249 family)|nr:ChbG/HpnK family deacetylase [Planctomycetota bacterium]
MFPGCNDANPPRRLIVNADDFGLSQAVNVGIVRAHREGILTAASLLANAPAFDEAVRMAEDAPFLGVGVHLNIVRGKPLSAPRDVPAMLDGDGTFKPLRLWRQRRDFLRQTEREYRSQIERVLRAGIAPTHVDFEKHHAWRRPLYEIAARLSAEYAIPRIRNLSEPVWWSLCAIGWPGTGRLCMAALLRAGTVRLREPEGVGRADRLLGQLHIGLLDEARWLALLARLPAGTSEVMTHPGLGGSNAAMGASWIDAAREAELRALVSPRVREAVAKGGIRLIPGL